MTTAAVVVPHYRDQARLDLVLAGLDLQTRRDFEVVVADDGSPEPPHTGDRPYPVRVVRQADEGFRASAARHLGASATDAGLLVFLDGDTVPEPAYLEHLLPVLGQGPRGTLAVGRRRHADLGGWTPDRLRAWLGGGAPAPTELPEPAWLTDAYAASDDLRDADDRSYRFVISAVMALPRELYARAGGFDPGFVGYGGEDWDLAHRCWLAGGDLRHVPAAVAWHDGPDFAGRGDDARLAKDAETLRLAHVLTDPYARGDGLVWEVPETTVTLHGRPDPGQLAATASSLLRGSDAAVWCADLGDLPAGLGRDPRLHTGRPPSRVLQRSRHRVDVLTPVLLDQPLAAVVSDGPADLMADGEVVARVRHTRDLARDQTTAPRVAAAQRGVRRCPGAPLEALWGGWA
ncbi:hypothetical protein GCM10027418_07970 [Mariniluteicoccus endophyticus]